MIKAVMKMAEKIRGVIGLKEEKRIIKILENSMEEREECLRVTKSLV